MQLGRKSTPTARGVMLTNVMHPFGHNFSRRAFGKMALAALPLPALMPEGPKLGVISYSFRCIPRPASRDYLDSILQACSACDVHYLELNAFTVEPPSILPGSGLAAADTPESRAARAQLRDWRLNLPMTRDQEIRTKCIQAGVDLFSYVMTFAEDFTPAEIEAVFRQAKALGVSIIGTNQTRVSMAQTLKPYAEKYGMDIAFHNHAHAGDPNEVGSPESVEKLFQMSPFFKSNLDVGHFVAGNNDPVAFIKRHHDRITHIHLKDRKKNDGPNMPWGQGDTPLREILLLVKEKRYPLVCVVEYEYPSADCIGETRRCLDFARAILGTL